MTILRLRKYALIGLDGEGHTMTLEPFEGIGWGELFEKTFQ